MEGGRQLVLVTLRGDREAAFLENWKNKTKQKPPKQPGSNCSLNELLLSGGKSKAKAGGWWTAGFLAIPVLPVLRDPPSSPAGSLSPVFQFSFFLTHSISAAIDHLLGHGPGSGVRDVDMVMAPTFTGKTCVPDAVLSMSYDFTHLPSFDRRGN